MAVLPLQDLKDRINARSAPYTKSQYIEDIIDTIDTLAALSGSGLLLDPGTDPLTEGDNQRVHNLGITVFKAFVLLTDSEGDFFVEPGFKVVSKNEITIQWIGDSVGDSADPPQIYYLGY